MIQSLNRNIALDHISMPYPHVEVLDPSDAVALIMGSLPKGDLAVICQYKGTVRKIGSIAYSALALLPLSNISKLKLRLDMSTERDILTNADILEAML